MELNKEQSLLLEFVKEQHESQIRKYTGEPYWTHPLAVAELVSGYVEGAVEIALCHDLLEDTQCTETQLFTKLLEIGYSEGEVFIITRKVVELTDVYVHEDFPKLNRKARKQLEAERLGKVSSLAQSVKYADLIDNTKSIVEHDKGFASVYLQEKEVLLAHMVNGDKELFDECAKSLEKSKKQL